MDFKEIQELSKILGESNLTWLELEKDGFKIVLKKEVEKVVPKEVFQGYFSGQIPEGQPAGGQPTKTEEFAKPYADKQTINAPIVGTFYASSSPEGEPFVQPGGRVKKGDALCIIEAMKLMNEIEAEEDLQIIDVLVKNGQMVEYGQPLFTVILSHSVSEEISGDR